MNTNKLITLKPKITPWLGSPKNGALMVPGSNKKGTPISLRENVIVYPKVKIAAAHITAQIISPILKYRVFLVISITLHAAIIEGSATWSRNIVDNANLSVSSDS